MLTRWEVEGELRSLYPARPHGRQIRRSHVRARRRLRITIAVLLGVTLASAIGAARVRSASDPSVATLQDGEWGAAHVGTYRAPRRPPLFPPAKRSPWESNGARAHAARERARLALR